MISPIVSVVIPTRDRPRAVERCLNALAGQTMPAGAFELIVVDDGSTTPLVLDAARWSRHFAITVIRQENTGPAGARNRGADVARGEFIAFTDDDCRPMPEWLGLMVAALRKTPGALVGGSTVNELHDEVFAETSQLIVDLVYEHFNPDPSRAFFSPAITWVFVAATISSAAGSTRIFVWPPRIVSSVTDGGCSNALWFGKGAQSSSTDTTRTSANSYYCISATGKALSTTTPDGRNVGLGRCAKILDFTAACRVPSSGERHATGSACGPESWPACSSGRSPIWRVSATLG